MIAFPRYNLLTTNAFLVTNNTRQGFFGAAPFMLTNPHWIAILRLLMPDVYVEISRRASYAPAPRLIHWAEK